MNKPDPREFETAYWYGYPQAAKPSSRGFPKTECGAKGKSMGAAGALRMINSGWVSKIQCIHRPSGRVVWTALRRRVPGLNVYEAHLIKGDYSFKVRK